MGILSTASEEGKPWGAAVYYVADEDFNIYFVTRTGSYKYQNLDKNPVVAFTVADAQTQTTVQVQGRVERIPVQKYMDEVANKLAHVEHPDTHNWTPPVEKIHEGNFMPLQIIPDKLRFANYSQLKIETKNTEYVEDII